MDGLLIVDKPAGPTSHDVVARVRRALGEKRIGHAGTLDPLATGVLLLVVGKATRLAKFLSASDKSYDAVVRVGFATDSADAEGRPLGPVSDRPMPSRGEIDAALDAFRGTFLQQPPSFSAKKIAGRRSYQLARAARDARHRERTLARCRESIADFAIDDPQDQQGASTQELQLTPDPCEVTSYAVSVVRVDGDQVTLTVDCSAGFYIRSLAHDLGERLGMGAHLTALRRTRTGTFGLERAMTLEAVERDPARAVDALVPMADMLPGLPSATLTAEGVRRVTHGQDIRPADQFSAVGPPPSAQSGQPFVRLLDRAGTLVAVAHQGADTVLHPSIVLV
jgi:tRNA pseudouridine55 synthase